MGISIRHLQIKKRLWLGEQIWNTGIRERNIHLYDIIQWGVVGLSNKDRRWKVISSRRYWHSFKFNCVFQTHSVESPSMVDPQWNIWYWGSKWNLHTVCWSTVGCEWGTTSVYFGITYVCFIPSRLPVFAVEPQYLLQYFLFLWKVSFELHIQNL